MAPVCCLCEIRMGILESASEDIKGVSTGDISDNRRGESFVLGTSADFQWVFSGSYNGLMIERLCCDVLPLVSGPGCHFGFSHGSPFAPFAGALRHRHSCDIHL